MENRQIQTIAEEDGGIYLHGERMVLTSSSIFGLLRKELIENIGMDRMKGFLIRYGWNLGTNDAEKVLEIGLESMEETLKQGPILHMAKGYTKVKRSMFHLEHDTDGSVTSVHVEGAWLNSYEAEEHLRQFGYSASPICHTLVGYASGYYSTISKQPVIFVEVSCKGMGDSECKYVGKTLHDWGHEVTDELKYYENSSIVKELQLTYEKLLEERNNLLKTWKIDKKLTEQIINGYGLQSIADVIFEITDIPIIIEDTNFRELAYSGIKMNEFHEINEDIKEYMKKKQVKSFSNTLSIHSTLHDRLVAPIMLHVKKFGYCSFIYQEKQEEYPEIDMMILERVATVCSLYLLNEKTSFDAVERMKGYFLEQLISEQFTSKKEILKRGSYINLDLDQPFHLVLLSYENIHGNVENDLQLNEELLEETLTFYKGKFNVLIGQRMNKVTILIQTEFLSNEDLSKHLKKYVKRLNKQYPHLLCKVGVSSKASKINRASEYYDEAVSSLRVATSNNKVVLFEELGVVGILVNSENENEIKKKGELLLGPLYQNSNYKKTELIKTLYVFLENGGNLEKTMEELALSMTGLRYRIKKIETLISQELRNPHVSYQLFLTLQALIMLGEITID
ncbi:XylR N-terminal domain-containing protein [Bacillus sp. FJAT-45350]|uniref:XylR N-terminal domain-containing protein n=1 Tax=Bacillus sp. FJAT-45350 TaxID=2011014 RepID=UPI0015C7EA96|nr:XylR N-terminal domain-containing protein [Bacillus sp. FJAT-45350]